MHLSIPQNEKFSSQVVTYVQLEEVGFCDEFFFYMLRVVNSPGLPFEELFPVKEISNTVVVRWTHYGGRIGRSIIF